MVINTTFLAKNSPGKKPENDEKKVEKREERKEGEVRTSSKKQEKE
jgi:hypothetical protein